MNFKILTLANPPIQVCLHRDRSEENQEIVRITTFLTDLMGQELMLETVAQFADSGSAMRFVSDYSEESAMEFILECALEDKISIVA